jgi:hypothetical protein
MDPHPVNAEHRIRPPHKRRSFSFVPVLPPTNQMSYIRAHFFDSAPLQPYRVDDFTVYRGGFNCRTGQSLTGRDNATSGIAAHEIGIVHYPGAQVAETQMLRWARSDQCIFNCSWQAWLKARNGSGNPWSINCLIPENVAFSLA